MAATAAAPSGCSAAPTARGTRLVIRRRRPLLLGILGSAVIATCTAAAFAAAVGGGVPAASAAAQDWIATGWNIHLADRLDPATTKHFFNTPRSFGTGPSASGSPVTNGFAAKAVLVFGSYAQFASDIRSGAIGPDYKWVLYDPEEWPQTPVAEQLSPVRYLTQFGRLAHAHGYRVIEAPSRDLGNVARAGSGCPELPGENLDKWYIHCDIAGAAAAASDVYVLQDQVNTANVTEYDALFASARRQALAANPQVLVDSELSTNYGTAQQMATAAKSVNADGFYVSITHPAIGQADQFFRLMRSGASCRPRSPWIAPGRGAPPALPGSRAGGALALRAGAYSGRGRSGRTSSDRGSSARDSTGWSPACRA